MAILESSRQTFSLISTIRTTYPGGVLSRSSTLTSKTIALSVNLPAGATINSVKFKCNISRVNPYYGADIHRINNVGVTVVIGPYEQILSNVASHHVKIEFKSTTNTGIYIPDDNYTQWIKYTDCHIVVDYTPGASTGALDKSSVPMDGASAITLAISPKNTAYSHKVKWKTGGAEITQNIAAGTTSAILTIPLVWNSQHPNAASGAASCELETYNGATLIGSVSYPFTVTVPSTIVPTALLAAEVVDDFNGLYLQRVSKARLITTAAGAYGSAIQQINVSGGGYSGVGSPYTTGVLQASGTVTFTVQVVDSRGRAATDTVSVTVVAYSKPSISDIEIFRCLSDGAPSKNGTYGKAVMTYAAAAVTGNSITAATVKFREVGTETYSAKTNVPSGSGGAIFGNGTLGVTKSFDVVLEVTDTVGQTSTYYGTITYKLAVFDFRKDKAGIGRVADPVKTLVLPEDWGIKAGVFDFQQDKAGIGRMAGPLKTLILPDDWKVKAGALDVLDVGHNHKNILHNWDFNRPINQRETPAGAIASDGYFYDRWRTSAGTIVEENGYVTVPVDVNLQQRIEGIEHAGKTYTYTCEDEAGVYRSVVVEFPTLANPNNKNYNVNGLRVRTGILADQSNVYLHLTPQESSITFVRHKLELGTVSTLHLDPPMDWAVELPKCQRFFEIMGGVENGAIATGMILDTQNEAMFSLNYAPKRVAPTIVIGGNIKIRSYLLTLPLSSCSVFNISPTEALLIVGFSQAAHTIKGHAVLLRATGTSNNRITISADL